MIQESFGSSLSKRFASTNISYWSSSSGTCMRLEELFFNAAITISLSFRNLSDANFNAFPFFSLLQIQDDDNFSLLHWHTQDIIDFVLWLHVRFPDHLGIPLNIPQCEAILFDQWHYHFTLELWLCHSILKCSVVYFGDFGDEFLIIS